MNTLEELKQLYQAGKAQKHEEEKRVRAQEERRKEQSRQQARQTVGAALTAARQAAISGLASVEFQPDVINDQEAQRHLCHLLHTEHHLEAAWIVGPFWGNIRIWGWA